MGNPFFITTAIDYTNGAPHIGHAYEKILADVLARYHRLKGDEVFFLTGVDQHGQKVQQSAEKQGVAPQEFVDGITAKFLALWEKLDVRYDGWAATTDQKHKDCVRAILQRLNDEGQIYKAKRAGYYSIRQEQFLTDKERNEQGEFGPEWGEVVFLEEENYYFKLAKHRDWLLALLDKRPDLVIPDFRLSELRNAVEKMAGDLCISRPKARLSWGIEFPFDPDFVTYVWFDALVNYISFAPGYDPLRPLNQEPDEPPLPAAVHHGTETASNASHQHDDAGGGTNPPASAVGGQAGSGGSQVVPNSSFLRLWRTVVHVIGKDILIPAHGVYWPIMLKALGFADEEMPKLLVHGWWNISGAKMSKSEGNVIDPNALADKYGAETLRYYLMADIATGRDADFSEERLIGRYNTDLANSLGNLLNRTLGMAGKYREGKLRYASLAEAHAAEVENESDATNRSLKKAFVDLLKDTPAVESDSENLKKLRHQVPDIVNQYQRVINNHSVSEAMNYVLILGGIANLLVEQSAPWKLAKDERNGDASAGKALDSVLYHLAESLRIIAILISPVLPKAAAAIFAQLNWTGPMTLEAAKWGALPDGHQLGQPTPLFPRIEAPAA